MTNPLLDLTGGTALVVTDLHGDLDAFRRCVTRFRRLHSQGRADRLILLGDLIHLDGPPEQDHSVDMVLEVIALREEFGSDRVIMLLGNHEMPHIYGVLLARGELEYTPRFEHALGAHRDAVIDLFMALPLYVRTAAGVMLGHAGPAAEVVTRAAELMKLDHETILADADATLAQAPNLIELYDQLGQAHGQSYAALSAHCLAVSGPDDDRYSHLLRAFLIGQQSRRFQLLWNALFTRNELGLPEDTYLAVCKGFLEAFSAGAPAPQRVMVSGHIRTLGGYQVINSCHLRLSSAAHAFPREAGCCLLLDCAAPVRSVMDLLPGISHLFQK